MKGTSALVLLSRSNSLGKLIFPCGQCALAKVRLLRARADIIIPKIQTSQFSTSDQHNAAIENFQGLWNKIKFDLGFIGGLKYNKSVLDLHIWLCMVRLGALGKDGRVLRNCLAKVLWEDVESRSKRLGSAASLTARKEGVRQMVDMFHASLFAYDEGLLGGDRQLAAAVWRIFFEMDHNVEPAHLELLVSYVRKQVAHLDSQEEAVILGRGFVTFLPLWGDKLDEDCTRRQALTVDRLRTKA